MSKRAPRAAKSVLAEVNQPVPVPVLAMSVPDAAKAIGIGRSNMWGLIRDGKVPVVKIGRRTLVSHASLVKLLQQ